MALTPVRVTGKYLSTDGRSSVDPTKLSALPPVKLPGEQYVYPVPAKLRGGGEFLLPLFADSATPLTYALTETLGGSTRTLSVTVPAGASGELALADLAGYSQPVGATLETSGDVSLVSLGADFVPRPAGGVDNGPLVADSTKPSGVKWSYRGPVNLRDYAAGDDSTDDTAGLLAAIDKVKTWKRPLDIPAGTYRIAGASADMRAAGLQVTTDGQENTIIKQMTANLPVVQLGHRYQHIGGIQAIYGTAATSAHTAANAFEFWHASKCLYENLYARNAGRGFAEPQGSYTSDGGVTANNFFFSNVCNNWQVTGFAIDGLNLYGGTGSVFNDVYISNNPNGTRLAYTGRAIDIRVVDEMVMNQVNVEWMLASAQDPIFIESAGNFVINALHIEQVDLSAFGQAFMIASDGVRLLINGMTLAFSSVTNSGMHSLFRHFGDSHIDLRGFYQKGNTVAGTFVLDRVNDAADGSSFVGNAVNTALFTAIAGNEKAAPLQVVRELNGNRYRWQQNGKNHTTGTAAPTTGTWAVGETVWNTAPAAAGAPAWVCTTAGTLPGTGAFKAMAALAA